MNDISWLKKISIPIVFLITYVGSVIPTIMFTTHQHSNQQQRPTFRICQRFCCRHIYIGIILGLTARGML